MLEGPDRDLHSGVYGGAIDHLADFVDRAIETAPYGLGAETIRHLVATYGEAYGEVLRLLDENPEWAAPVCEDSPTIGAQIVYGVRAEMAQTLVDVILRRTELGAAGYPGDDCLRRCAAVMAEILSWDDVQIAHEIEAVQSLYRRYEPALRCADLPTNQPAPQRQAEIAL